MKPFLRLPPLLCGPFQKRLPQPGHSSAKHIQAGPTRALLTNLMLHSLP